MCSSNLVERSINLLEQKEHMTTINLAQLFREFNIANPSLLITREKGQKVYSAFQHRFAGKDNLEGPIIIEFPENQLMDVSFADEVVIRIGEEIRKGKYGEGQGMILQGLGEDSIQNLNAAVNLQKLKTAFLVLKPSGEWECVGHLEQNLRNTLDLLYAQKQLTAQSLVRQLGLAINTASTRLKRLYDLHLIKRDFEITENGLQYIYHFWSIGEKHD
jgi:DNA-binding transcriptional ArsR family regulator